MASGSTKPSPDESGHGSYTEAEEDLELTYISLMWTLQTRAQEWPVQLQDFVEESFFLLTVKDTLSEARRNCFPEAACQLDKLLKFKHQEIGQSIIDSTKKIRRLK
ncbi:hypothetical protein NC651_000042 [Populus alba x Populus x berolinensis]|nr:hypothetical protein NC651_000042 [Populus alba x Populus x berolinensis]